MAAQTRASNQRPQWVAVKSSDPEAPLSARLQGSAPEKTQIASPSRDGRLSGKSELPGPPEPSEPGRRARIAAVGAIVLVSVAVALAVLLQTHRKPQASASSGVPAGDTTATVQRRTLTEHAQVDGTLGYGSTLELFDRISGTFTWLPSVGSVIDRGGTLFKMNQLPIVLMYGPVPAYRTLKEGVSGGQDVAQLNENLVALGYDPYGAIADYESFGEATATAVRRWQKAEGLPQTGEVELGRVIFAPSARRVTALKATLGQDPPGEPTSGSPSGSSGPAEASKDPAEKSAGEGAKKQAGDQPKNKGNGDKAASGKPSPAKEAAKDPAGSDSPSKSPSGEKSPASENSGASAGTPALTTTSTEQIVQVALEADKQQLARVGESAPVTLPSGQSVSAHITSVGTVATESSGGGGESGGGKATIAATLSLDHDVPHLDAAPVTVELIKEKRRNVLCIPATALIATAGGGYAVQALESGRRVEVPVTPGMFADGYVQIEGQGIYEGLTITQPSE